MKKKIYFGALFLGLISLTTLNFLRAESARSLNLSLESLIQQAIAEDEGGGGECQSMCDLVNIIYYEPCGGILIAYEHFVYWCLGYGGTNVCIEGDDFWQYDYVDCQWSETKHLDMTDIASCTH
jgi:hypothetical protein